MTVARADGRDGGDDDGQTRPEKGEEGGQQWRDGQAEQGEHDLLAVVAADRDPQDRQLLDRDGAPGTGRQGLHPPDAQPFDGCRRAGCRRLDGAPLGVLGWTTARARRPDRGPPGSGARPAAPRPRPIRAPAVSASCRPVAIIGLPAWRRTPMNLGSGFPVDIVRIHSSVATYRPSSSTSSSCPTGVP